MVEPRLTPGRNCQVGSLTGPQTSGSSALQAADKTNLVELEIAAMEGRQVVKTC